MLPAMMASVPAAIVSIIIYEYTKKKALKATTENGEENGDKKS